MEASASWTPQHHMLAPAKPSAHRAAQAIEASKALALQRWENDFETYLQATITPLCLSLPPAPVAAQPADTGALLHCCFIVAAYALLGHHSGAPPCAPKEALDCDCSPLGHQCR